MEKIIEAVIGKTPAGLKSRVPAKLDMMLTGTGVFLALFMIAHMFFVSSILLGKNAMYTITKMFELEFIFEGGIPQIVSVIAVVVTIVFVVHGILGTRKFPLSYRAFLKISEHKKMMHHKDTSMWYFQFVSGLIMMFIACIHLFIMFTQPQNIGPFGSADRVFSDHMWILYAVLLVCVEIHGSVGLYRAAVKWGWFDGENPKETRIRLKRIKSIMSAFFLLLGFTTLVAYFVIGANHADQKGQKFVPTAAIETRG